MKGTFSDMCSRRKQDRQESMSRVVALAGWRQRFEMDLPWGRKSRIAPEYAESAP
jgi:hypothetical protein